MAEGKMSFDSGQKAWKIVFYNEKKKGDSTLFCRDKKQFSANLNLDEKMEIEVEFDRSSNGDPTKIRPKGQEWQGEEIKEKKIDYQGVKQQAMQQSKQQNKFGGNNKTGFKDKNKENNVKKASQQNEGDFHNPYNFVPAIPRKITNTDLDDREPSGHDRFVSDKFNGKLTVKMKVETPLVVIDTARIKMQGDHKKYPVRIENGKPYIEPTAIKGMLRSAYEAITNSRISIFSKHEDRLAFRGEVNEGLFVIPARIEGTKNNEKIIFYTGKSELEEDGGPKIIQQRDRKNNIPEIRESQYAAWLRMYETNDFDTANGERIFAIARDRISLKNTSGENPKHSNRAWAWIEEFKYRSGRFTYWKVMEIAYNQADLSTSFPKSSNSISLAPEKVEGYICNTGKTMKSKHDERFFFGRNSSYIFDLEKKHKDFWTKLIKNYRKQHESDFDSPPMEKIRGGVNDGDEYSLEWSRHIQRTTIEEISDKKDLILEELKDGTLCYAKVKKNGTNFEILELYPVMISRRLHEISPMDLLDSTLKPAIDIEKLSPADRVFGCVIQNQKNMKKANAYRGQVRIGSITCQNDNAIQKFQNEWLPMNILGQPKPQQGRFYVAETPNGEAQTEPRNNENAGYKAGRGLRGRKVYPHHSILPSEFWFDSPQIDFTKTDLTQNIVSELGKRNSFREYLRPYSNKQRDNQNRSIEGWIKPETKFEFDIHLTNLSEVELGALVWLLQMNNGLAEAKYFHRFGGGKPLGFGSVKLELDETKSDIRSGKELAEQRYTSLGNDVRKCENVKTNFVDKFESAYKTAGYERIIESFKAACEGFNDNKPIHYPRKDKSPNPEGKNFEWFVANSSKDGRKLSLPNLDSEIGLPLEPKH